MSTPTVEAGIPTERAATDPPTSVRRGQHGRLLVHAELIAGRTRLTDVQQQPPLQVLRAHNLDADLPDLATVTIASPAGGILQGDVLETTIRVGAVARLTVGTQSATRIYRAPDAPAASTTILDVRPGAYLEYLPDPYIPYDGSRFRAMTTCTVAEDGTLILADALVGGRLARGERFGLESFESVVDILRPDGDLIARDAVTLGADPRVERVGRLGRHLALGTLYVVHAGFGAALLREAALPLEVVDVAIGASDLPNRAGAWLRVLGRDAGSVSAVLRAAWARASIEILGVAPGVDRRP
jgi:urease accessory protein